MRLFFGIPQRWEPCRFPHFDVTSSPWFWLRQDIFGWKKLKRVDYNGCFCSSNLWKIGPNFQAEPQTPRLLCQTRSLSRPTKQWSWPWVIFQVPVPVPTDPFSWLEQILFFLHCDKRVEDDNTINISPLRTEVAGWGIPTKLQWWLELWGIFPHIARKKSGLGTIWSKYSDLTRVFTPKWWFSKGNPLIWVHPPLSNSQRFSSGVKNSGIFWLGDVCSSPPWVITLRIHTLP